MKKQLLALAVLGSSIASAQVWSENFSTPTPPALPATWMQNNVDGLTPSSSLSTYNFGTNAWVTTNNFSATYPTHGRVAASTSWYAPVGTSNDWLISPSFNVPANAVLQWDAIATDPNFPDGYQVKISTTGTVPANFSNLQTVTAENSTWTNRSLSLNTYSNQTVYIAFVNNSNDQFILLLDNIQVLIPASNDGNVASITGLTRYMIGAGNQNITGSFKSMGYSPATSAVLNYKVNNGATITQTITFSALNYGQSTNYSFTTPAALALGTNKVKTWVTHVNSIPETNFVNDTAYSLVYVASQGVQRAILVEEWSSSTCAPCANLNVTLGFDAMLDSNTPNTGGDVNVVKYQMNWPSPNNDPSYNSDGLDRRLHYDVNAVPDSYIDGTYNMSSHTQGELDAAKALPAYADITATISAKTTTVTSAQTTVVATATITPYVTITSNSPVRVFQALCEKAYHYQSNTVLQHDFIHAMRKMSPNGWGTPTVITDGSPFTVSFNINPTIGSLDPTTPAQMSFNFWTNTLTPVTKKDIVYEYVVWLQDTVSNDVLQSSSWSASVTVPTSTQTTVGIKEMSANQQIAIYPNPAKDFAVVSINLEKAAVIDVTIYDIAGKVVYTNKGGSAISGRNDMNINTSEFASGTYNVVVKAGDAVLRDKLLISK